MSVIPTRARQGLQVLCFLAAAALPIVADAKKSIWYHWEEIGSSGDPGGQDIYFVIDGEFDDGTDENPGRFPMHGQDRARSKTTDRKIKYPKASGKGCTIAPNMPGNRGLPRGITTWKYYIAPTTSSVMQAAFRAAFEAVNKDQASRGSNFSFQETTNFGEAKSAIAPPTRGLPPLRETDIATTHVRNNRDGSVRTTWTATSAAPIPYSLAKTAAAHEVGHITGSDDTYGLEEPSGEHHPDADYPTVMYFSPTAVEGASFDPCTLAAIDANVNPNR
ncbi:MAG TPA: hypothetical protein VF132_08695 [Rudaea sp.]